MFYVNQVEKQPTKTLEFNSLIDILLTKSQNEIKKTALIFLENGHQASASLTYQNLDIQARKIAIYLRKYIQVGDKVLLLHPPGLEFVKAFFGCLYAGAIAIPVYPPRPNRSSLRIKNIIADSQAKVAITTQRVLTKVISKFSSNRFLNCLNWLTNEQLENHNYELKNWDKPVINKDTIAFLQYTSGSTGKPKGVMVSHGNILYNSEYIKKAFALNEKSVSVSWLPHFHDMGLIDGLIQPLYTGYLGLLMPPIAFLGRPIRWLEAISTYKATHCGGPNFAYELCLNKIKPEQKDNLDLSSWTTAYNGAEPVRKDTLTKFADYFADCGFQPRFFYPCYGLAEATLMVTGVEVDRKPNSLSLDATALTENRVLIADNNLEKTKEIVSCGYCRLETEVVIVNPYTLTPTSATEIGEIWVSGETVAKGYWRNAEATERTFFHRLKDRNHPFMRTGDLGFIYRDELYITGRVKDLIVIKGENYYPQDIELTVSNSNPALRKDYSAAFSLEINRQERLVIVQEVKRDYLKKIDVEAVTGDVCQGLMKHHDLQAYDLVLIKTNSISKTSSGKIQRQLCRQQYLEGSLSLLVSQINNPALGKNRI